MKARRKFNQGSFNRHDCPRCGTPHLGKRDTARSCDVVERDIEPEPPDLEPEEELVFE